MKIFGSDYDGTLYHHNHGGVSEEDVKMIQAFRKQGGLFGLVSGRPVFSLMIEAEKHNIEYDFMIGLNGGMAVDKDHNDIFKVGIKTEIAKKIRQLLLDFDALSFGMMDASRRAYYLKEEVDDRSFPADNVSFEEIYVAGVLGFFSHFGDSEKAYEVMTQVNNLYGDEVTAHQNGEHVDISGRGVSKASGIKKFLELMNWNPDEIYVIGDAGNDFDMIQTYYGFAMENGLDEVKEIADSIVPTVSAALKSVIK